ncbi:MAG: 3D domain-containing protein [Acidaminococcaceae bacterium]
MKNYYKMVVIMGLCSFFLTLGLSPLASAASSSPQVTKKLAQPVTAAVVAKRGMSGVRIEQLQIMLAEIGFYKKPVDGEFGTGTEQAVRAFERRCGKVPTGFVTAALEAELRAASKLDLTKCQRLVLDATAYSPEDPGNGSYTATGELLRKGIVAVDPYVIALGTQMYIVGYGHGRAADTGGAIQGNIIDVGFATHHEALSFGRRNVIVYLM